MSLKLKRFDQGVWFDYLGGGSFKIRPNSSKDYLDIREKSRLRKEAILLPDGKTEIIDIHDEAKFIWEIFNYTLEDWKDIETGEGETTEVIRKNIFNDIKLRDWIVEKSNEIFGHNEIKLEEELKNSGSSQSG